MATGQNKVSIYLKKFLPQQQMVDNFLDYLRNQDIENLKLQYPNQGFFFGQSMAGSGADQFTAATPSLATDGQGNLLKLDPSDAATKFENANGVLYHVGMRYNVLEQDTEVNVRTGQIEYTFLKDAIGEKGQPNSVIDNGSTLRLVVDSVTEVGVSNAGRKAIVYLKRAKGQADAFFIGQVSYVSGQNVVDTTHLIGQTAGLVSTTPADYVVFIPGLTVRKNTNLSLDPNYVYYGTITGAGAGTTPASGQINNTLANVLYGGGSFTSIVNSLRAFLVGGGNIIWDLANEELTWGADIRFKPASVPYDYQIAADTVVVQDGECGYFEIDGLGGIKTLVIAPLSAVPDDPKYFPIFYRYGSDILFVFGALELKGDAASTTEGRFDGTTQDILDYMGATDESDADPAYINALGTAKQNIHLVEGESLTKAIKRLEMRDDVIPKVRAIDFNLTALPFVGGAGPALIDGQTLVNGDFVLFAHASLNKIARITGIGTSIAWTDIHAFGGNVAPSNLSMVGVEDGSKEFLRSVFKYTSTTGWKPLDLSDMESEPSGFENQEDSEISFDAGTRTFTIQPKSPATAFFVAQKGKLFKFETPQTIVIPDTEGMHFIYFDGATLQTTQVFDYAFILGKAFVSSLYWDAANNVAVMFSNERHQLTMDGRTHLYLHNTQGVQWVSGLGLNYTPGAGSANSDAQISVEDGVLFDEDLSIDIKHDPTPTEMFEQILNPIAEIPILYRSGLNGDWRKYAATQFPAKLGTSRLQYNDPLGPWTTPDATADGRFVAMWLFATNDVNNPVIAIMGQREDSSLVNAQANNRFDTLLFGELPSLEMKGLFRIILETSSAFTNTIKSRIVDVVDIRKAEDTALGSYAPTAHNLLSARTAPNSHPSSAIQPSTTNFAGALSSLDNDEQKVLETLDKHFQQLRLKEHPSNKNRVVLSGASVILNSGTVLEQQVKNLILKFDGAQIDFSTGEIFEADGTTPFNGGANDFTPVVPASALYRWFSITLLPGTANVNNTINGQLLVLVGASDGATPLAAPRAAFASGTKIGQVVVQEDTGSIADILQSAITQQGTGGGGSGDATGNANLLELELRARLRVNNFDWVTPNIAQDNNDDLLDTGISTATYDIANNVFKFTAIGSILQSIQLLDQRFLGLDALYPDDGYRPLEKVELHANWTTIDTGAIYQVSRDGGLNWLTLTMNRHGSSKYYLGSGTFPTPVTTENLIQYPTAVTPVNVDMTAAILKRAVKVTVTEKSKYQTVNFKYNKVGSPLGTFGFNWVKNNGGVPSTNPLDVLASSNLLNLSSLSAGPNSVNIDVPAVLPPGVYWLVIESDSAYQASYVNGVTEVEIQSDSAGTYAGGVSYEFDGTTWTPTASRQILFGTSGYRFKLLVKITSSVLDVNLEGYGVFYGESGGVLEPLVDEPQYFEFTGSEDKTEFIVTNFLPDPKKVKVHFINTGLTLLYPFFNVQGNKLIFESGTFLYPSVSKLYVKVEQQGDLGSADANVSRLAVLLAENALGSEDPSFDMSQAGKGIKLRRPDGTLRMVRLDNNDDLIVESLP